MNTTPASNSSTGNAETSASHTFRANDGTDVHYRYWAPATAPTAVIQIVHGAAEHGGRYERFARALVGQGYAVYATDHRGHGRTRIRSGELGDAGPDAWNRFVEDEQQLSQSLRERHPTAKLVLFGHSMGSFITQDYMTRRPDLLDAVILSGTAYGPPPPKEAIEALNAVAQASPLGPSQIWSNRFADFNKPFTGKPGFEWLSRDPEEVRKYEEDPLAGFAFTNELVRDFFQGMALLRDPAREARIPSGLPVLVIQGALDPVGANLQATHALLDRFNELGLTRVSHHFYPEARHELLNETNRDEVQRDVLNWLASVLK
ncbi:MAG TPA: alpha/beta hydrolase [Noviherbaspirillum sp.]|jgi:alpha-beta hydrolase superfamily lysophospholipase|uniref:alpha/beta hydrolase n=1 Tax=Noviherbaspirillum sp. TaxID=1926288 RepID=UPI002DDD7C0F|nr:lysophospholipase [Noviherbaspirillum sp.]HEV2611713.1 alpha/beta hydrolase [Noviherbaspirillum sp.]